MSVFPEQKLFSVCLESEKKNMIIKALDTQLDILIENHYSEKMIEKYRWLKEEIDKMNICTKE